MPMIFKEALYWGKLFNMLLSFMELWDWKNPTELKNQL